MKRDFALRRLKRRLMPDDIVVAVYQALFDWIAINPYAIEYNSKSIYRTKIEVTTSISWYRCRPARRKFSC